MTNNYTQKEVAFRDFTMAKEKLPYPWVLYPSHYGTFFGFRKNQNSPLTLCSCSKFAILNYLKFRVSETISDYSDPGRMYILDSFHFPRMLVDSLMNKKAPKDESIVEHLRFHENLCHECNNAVPYYRYCLKMYGASFKQNFGWYINKQAYEFGIIPDSGRLIPEVCPQEILDLSILNPRETKDLIYGESNIKDSEADKLGKELNTQIRNIWNLIENEVRLKFGHKKVGEAWTNETMLYHIICKLYPKLTILRHYHPDFLEGLELDIFIKEANIGVEYQGKQHFEPVAFWGGVEALKRLQQRDKKKKKSCDAHGVTLIYFNYDEGLEDKAVLTKLKPHV